MNRQLIAFLAGDGPDDQGRRISEIIGWSDYQLESCHDFIQWVFPNRVASRFNPVAPILDKEVIEALATYDAATSNIRQMLFRMYSFYEFEVTNFDDGTYQLGLVDDLNPPRWVRPGDHNFLRLSRILLCLKELHLVDDFAALADILDLASRKYHTIIGTKTANYWRGICALPD
jgi:hypothetical protein